MPLIVPRAAPIDAVERLVRADIPPLLARLYAARGIRAPGQLDRNLGGIIPPERMHNLRQMAGLLADAISNRKQLLIVADYDVDGATACAVGLRALRACGASVDYLVPDRFTHGYGLTPEIVRLAADTKRPDILITVDNGIASVEGVAEANRLGLKVLITDHHLPGPRLPDAWCIINPNQPACEFPGKHLAGVGVMFYLMLALRAELRRRGAFSELPNAERTTRHDGTDNSSSVIHHSSFPRTEPNLAELLPLVALGTVADVVKLDDNNRILVHHGLERVRAGRPQPGIAALFQVAGRDPRRATVHDLGFALAPRLNAAGRLADMALGIECLASDDARRVAAIAAELDHLNRERRTIEAGMQETALAAVERMELKDGCSLSLFHPEWHQGVVGIVASRIKDRYHRPTIAFARSGDGEIRGSGRSIPGLHLRDALDLVAKRHPDLILKFGGHAAAAGLTLREFDFQRFSDTFENTAQALLTPDDLERQIETDGTLEPAEASLETAALLRQEVWGHGFPEPRFCDRFDVVSQRTVGERHLKLRLARRQRVFDAMLFGSTPALPARIDAVYRLDVNDYNGSRSVQLTVEHWKEC
ncbi:MAG: single-stranded-DNA-specific exonuclease RecJ [Betaproteobacteria bacterium]|nr:single-stranded-DNA-specific exonuclease RecJ [Betaproteobacteria bacterium]